MIKIEKQANKREWQVVAILIGLVLCNLGLALGKLYIGIANNSLPILIDATNNFFDIISAVIVIIGFVFMIQAKGLAKRSNKKGRAEYVVNFLSNVILIGLGLMFLYLSAVRLNLPAMENTFSWTYFGALIATVVVKIIMGIFTAMFHKKLKSKALSIITLDNLVDSGMTSFVALSYVLRLRDFKVVLDGIFGLILSIAICILAIKMIIDTWGQLVGTEIDKQKKEITKVIKEIFPDNDCGDLILHDYGVRNRFGTVKVAVDETQLLQAMKDKRDNENKIKELTSIPIGIEFILHNHIFRGLISPAINATKRAITIAAPKKKLLFVK